jgi:hypothetical protein
MEKSDPYEFIFQGGRDNLYAFATALRLVYEVKFKPSGYLFDDAQPFIDSIFEMVLLPVKADADKEKLFDARIPATINAIVRDFFSNKETVLLYICENRDGRGGARNRKFAQWFELYGLQSHFRLDFEISDADERYLNSVIGRIDNPYRVEVILACFELAESNSK